VQHNELCAVRHLDSTTRARHVDGTFLTNGRNAHSPDEAERIARGE
jgi:hypothetical protein